MTSTPYQRYKHEEMILRDLLATDRTLLALERTLLAYVRTAFTLVLAGLSVIQIFSGFYIIVLGILSVLVGIMVSFYGLLKFYRFRHILSTLREEDNTLVHSSNFSQLWEKIKHLSPARIFLRND